MVSFLTYVPLIVLCPGKLLNVREASHKQILENAEINNIIKILGLQYKKKYENDADMKTLRYGKLMIMTDQDQVCNHLFALQREAYRGVDFIWKHNSYSAVTGVSL